MKSLTFELVSISYCAQIILYIYYVLVSLVESKEYRECFCVWRGFRTRSSFGVFGSGSRTMLAGISLESAPETDTPLQ